MAHFYITKADGERERFDPVKLEQSLSLAGASTTVRARIVSQILHEFRPLMKTEDIYRHAFEILKQHEQE